MTQEHGDQVTVCQACGSRNRVRAAASGVPHCGTCGRPLPWVADSGQDDFAAVVERSSLPVLVDFWAPWCGPCRMVEPVVRQMSRDLAGRLKVVRVNTDEAPGLGQRFQVLGIPTLMLFDQGRERDRITGAVDGARMRSWLDSLLRSASRE
jgi:thioredoxin 2